MFERFTDRARRVVVLAQEEARLLRHNYIGSEHLLLGLLRSEDGPALVALGTLGLEVEMLRERFVGATGYGKRAPSGHIPFTPHAKKILEYSLREAIDLGHKHIGTEHILLGIVREHEGVAAQCLVALGADETRVRDAVLATLSGVAPDDTNPRFRASVGHTRVVASGSPQQCSFCGHDLWEIGRYIHAETARICDACVEAARQTFERTPDASGAVMLPPRVFGAVPEPDAPPAIERAFRVLFELDNDDVARVAALEDGEHLTVYVAESRERTMYAQARVYVRAIRFERPDEADVRFSILMGPSAMPIAFEGRAVHRQSGWKVSRETFGQIVALVGVQVRPAR